jgi:hypothetical protein
VFDRFGFTLSVLSLHVWFMAGNPNRIEAVPHDISWIGKEPLDAISLFFSNGAMEIPHLSVGRKEDWEVNFLSTSDRICSKYVANRIPMYETVFKEMGVQAPVLAVFHQFAPVVGTISLAVASEFLPLRQSL